MIQKVLKIENRLGLHARAAAKLVHLAGGFKADIHLSRLHGNQQINARSILGILMLAAAQGTELVVTLQGEDESAAARAIEDLFVGKFGEIA